VTPDVFLFLSAFLASAVEMVEALTIVLAVGVTRGWRSTLRGIAAAAAALAVVVAALGPAISALPLNTLRLVVGALLLVFGLQWLRKAILRASGYVPLHDEDAIYRRELDEARDGGIVRTDGTDWYAFALAFKGVFLEGLEVAFIVVTFGAARHNGIGLAAAAAAAAFVLVASVGAAARAPLSRVPENALKLTVGLLLTSFGTFWGAEGAHAEWPGDDAALLGLLVFFGLATLAAIRALRRRRASTTRMAAAEARA
jgi:uncharacterized membrane protein